MLPYYKQIVFLARACLIAGVQIIYVERIPKSLNVIPKDYPKASVPSSIWDHIKIHWLWKSFCLNILLREI